MNECSKAMLLLDAFHRRMDTNVGHVGVRKRKSHVWMFTGHTLAMHRLCNGCVTAQSYVPGAILGHLCGCCCV